MDMDLLLTCDAGTSGVKCSLFDARGLMQGAVRGDYATHFPKPGWAEQSPEEIADAMVRCIALLTEKVDPARIACVGLSGTMNGCIPTDETGRALHPNIIHSDARAASELPQLARVLAKADFYRLTGNRLDCHYTLPKILWLRAHLPDVYRRTRWWLNTKDYLYARLTGRVGFTDYSDASLTTALDIRAGIWAQPLLRALDLEPEKMPRILAGHDVSGRVSPEIARATGLLAGTPVAIGGGDGACAASGAGVHAAGSGYMCLGSSAWISQLTDAPVLDPQARLFNYLDMDGRSNHLCGTIQCGADALAWAAGNLLDAGADAIERAEALARGVAPGAEGVLFLPTLMGERTPYWDPNTRGCLTGFTLYHNRAHIARAVYEGVAFALYGCAQAMAECRVPVRSLMLTGGGANSGLWPDIFASAFDLPVMVHATPGEATSLGAAIAAGVGVGMFPDYQEAARIVRASRAHEPNPCWQEAYRSIYPLYAQLYARMKPIFDGMHMLH